MAIGVPLEGALVLFADDQSAHGLGRVTSEPPADARIGITLNLGPTTPATADPADVAAAERVDALATNALVEGQGGRVALVMIGFGPDDLARDGLAAALGGDPVLFCPGGHDVHGNATDVDLGPLDKQLDAMSEGGDDFLTKPIKPRHLIATVRNRAARARSLKARMVRDSLTGLYNHTHTLQLLEDASYRARREGQPLAFAMLDIDHFKKVNDSYGHPMGDRVIKSLALFLKQRLRKTDHIGRYGGEEFAVVLPDTDSVAAHKVLEEIRQRFAEIRYPAKPADLACTFSCGIAQLGADEDATVLARRADEALYRAKHGGRNRVEVFA